MQKKWFSLILAIALCFAFTLAFAGCGGSGTVKKKEFTVTFDSSGGTEVQSVTVKEGEKINEPNKPSKATLDEQYKFVGWFNGETKWDFGEDVVGENITLTAKWEKGEEFTKGYLPKS